MNPRQWAAAFVFGKAELINEIQRRCGYLSRTTCLTLSYLLEAVAKADINAPGFGEISARGALDICVELRERREVIVPANAVLNPGIAHILLIRTVTAPHYNVAVKLMKH